MFCKQSREDWKRAEEAGGTRMCEEHEYTCPLCRLGYLGVAITAPVWLPVLWVYWKIFPGKNNE